MLDIKWIMAHEDCLYEALHNRGVNDSEVLQTIADLKRKNEVRKDLQKQFDELRAEQNRNSQEVAKVMKSASQGGTFNGGEIANAKQIAEKLKILSAQQSEAEENLKSLLLEIPNIPDPSVPVGANADANTVVKTVGQKPEFDFVPKTHDVLGENLGYLDFERATKISGARFSILRGPLAKLERALARFMLQTHTTRHGYEEIHVPFLVNATALTGTGQLPKFEQDLFATNTGHYLIPTAEVPVTNVFAGETLDEKHLPLSFVAYTPCFRSEAGSHGKDVKGLIRQHQFTKVELVKLTAPHQSRVQHEQLTTDAEFILEALGLCYRRVLLCTGDMGFGSSKTYDLEVWLPGQNQFREISSCTNFLDFQARRMGLKFKPVGQKPEFAHTLNGSGLAVGRTLVAILENYQQKDETIKVPEVLQGEMGCEVISSNKLFF